MGPREGLGIPWVSNPPNQKRNGQPQAPELVLDWERIRLFGRMGLGGAFSFPALLPSHLPYCAPSNIFTAISILKTFKPFERIILHCFLKSKIPI